MLNELDAETMPLRNPQHYQYDFKFDEIAEVWRCGSVIASWPLDLTAAALHHDEELAGFTGRVSASGEGRWTLQAAIEEEVRAAFQTRFSSRGGGGFADKLLSAMRYQFGDHVEKNQ